MLAHNPVPMDQEAEADLATTDSQQRSAYASWMPMSSDGIVAQSALTICSPNLYQSVAIFCQWRD